jgi:hypothetical protein
MGHNPGFIVWLGFELAQRIATTGRPQRIGVLRRTMPDSRSKLPRPSHNSPSSGKVGRPARNQPGVAMRRPLRKRSTCPSHRARTPSSFSLTRKSAGLSPVCQFLPSMGARGKACGARTVADGVWARVALQGQ